MEQTLPAFTGNDPLDRRRLSLNNGIHQGDFFIGPPIHGVNPNTIRNMMEYLAKRDGTNEFVTLKVLTISNDSETNDDRQGKVLLHNERLILSLLNDQPGVIHHHGLFRDRNHFILVMDCLVAHDYDSEGRYKDYVNLQHYVIKRKKLNEKEALEMFHSILTTVRVLHSKNIVHRDIKLGNMVLNLRTRRITLTNFGLSKHLVRSGDLLTDQRGSLAYVSPDVLSGNPYDGKASDMWAMGVLLYTMLYGQFPFYDDDIQELFKKIRAAEFNIPSEGHIKMHETSLLVRQLIERNAERRLSAAQTLDLVQRRLSRLATKSIIELASQVVPDSMGPVRMDDCMVPEQQDDSSLSSLEEATNASSIHLNTVQLTLNPMLLAESHTDHVINSNQLVSAGTPGVARMHVLRPIATSPITIAPNSLSAGTFVPYILTDFPPTHVHRPRPSSNGNPFLQVYSSDTVSSNTSPTHSLNVPPISPPNVTTGHQALVGNPISSSSLNSYPQTLVCHRYPLTLSLSTDSYFSSSPGSSGEHTPTHHHVLFHASPHSSSQSLSQNSSLSHRSVQHSQRLVVHDQNVTESLVTVRTSRHSLAGASVTINAARSSHGHGRHSFSEGDRPNPHLLIPSQTHSQTQRRRRNSSGCENSVSQSPVNRSGSSLDVRRHRRRSHDARAEQSELLASLDAVASRRRRSHSSPFQVPVQIHYSPPVTQAPTTAH